jgi:WD40 repeat protein
MKQPVTLSEVVSLPSHTDWVYNLAFSPDGKTLATGSYQRRETRLWNVGSWTQKTTLAGSTGVMFIMAFSPDGQTLATATADNSLRLWNSSTGALIWSIPGRSKHVEFSPDGQLVASTNGKTVRINAAGNGLTRFNLTGHTTGVEIVAFSIDGSVLASSAGQQLHLWDPVKGYLKAVLQNNHGRIYCLSPVDQLLAAVGHDGIARIWDAQKANLKASLTGHNEIIWQSDFSRDGKFLATGGKDGSVRVWDIQTSAQVAEFRGSSGSGLQFSPSGKLLAAANFPPDHSVHLRSMPSMELAATAPHPTRVQRLAFSPEGRWLATACDDGNTRIWDLGTVQ